MAYSNRMIGGYLRQGVGILQGRALYPRSSKALLPLTRARGRGHLQPAVTHSTPFILPSLPSPRSPCGLNHSQGAGREVEPRLEGQQVSQKGPPASQSHMHIRIALKPWPTVLGGALFWFALDSLCILKLLFQKALRLCGPTMVCCEW